MEEVQGGYIAVRAGEILNLFVAYKDGLRPSCVRLYLAAHLESTEQLFTPNYEITLDSLCRRANLAYRTGQDALRELEAYKLLTLEGGVITFARTVIPKAAPYLKDLLTSEDRPVPVPPSLMRLLAKHSTGSEIITALAHMLRCLFINRGTIRRTGFIKNSLITKLTGLGERAIQGARNWMIRVGFLITKTVKKRFTNRHGGCFVVKPTNPQNEQIPALLSSTYVGSAPPLEATPIYINNDLNNQYVPPIDDIPTVVESGVCKQTIQDPTIRDIKLDDLTELPRLEALYRQAVERNWLPDCEASVRNFIAAASRAVAINGNPVRVFVGIVKKGLWNYITQAQEDIALLKLKRYQVTNPEAFTKQGSKTPLIQQEMIIPRERPKEQQRPERRIFRAGRHNPQTPPKEIPPLSELLAQLLAQQAPTKV